MKNEYSKKMFLKNKKFAGLWFLFLALFIDFLFFCIIFSPITKVIKGVWFMGFSNHQWKYGLFISDPLCLAFLLFMFLFYVILEGTTGATLGKWIVGLRVIGAYSGKISLSKSLLRNILRLIDGLPAFNIIGIIFIINSPEKARFGDKVAGTRVIKIK